MGHELVRQTATKLYQIMNPVVFCPKRNDVPLAIMIDLTCRLKACPTCLSPTRVQCTVCNACSYLVHKKMAIATSHSVDRVPVHVHVRRRRPTWVSLLRICRIPCDGCPSHTVSSTHTIIPTLAYFP